MSFTAEDARLMQQRCESARNCKRADFIADCAGEPAPDGAESKLHDQIEKWCNAQWPRWKVLYARRDKSPLVKGAMPK
jgi:hypothetical protein